MEETIGGGIRSDECYSKKESIQKFCKTGLKEHKDVYRRIKNHTKKVIAKAMKMEAEKKWTN